MRTIPGRVHIPATLEPIARSRREANKIKLHTPIDVVIGNPPYGENARGLGGWIETGDPGHPPPLDAFRAVGGGKYENVLPNLYVYFWRWAAWKAWRDPCPRHHRPRRRDARFLRPYMGGIRSLDQVDERAESSLQAPPAGGAANSLQRGCGSHHGPFGIRILIFIHLVRRPKPTWRPRSIQAGGAHPPSRLSGAGTSSGGPGPVDRRFAVEAELVKVARGASSRPAQRRRRPLRSNPAARMRRSIVFAARASVRRTARPAGCVCARGEGVRAEGAECLDVVRACGKQGRDDRASGLPRGGFASSAPMRRSRSGWRGRRRLSLEQDRIRGISSLWRRARGEDDASAPPIASSTEAARASGPSPSARACARDRLSRTTRRTRRRNEVPGHGAADVAGAHDRGCYRDSFWGTGLMHPDVVREQPEGLVGPDPVDRLPVLFDEPVLEAEEVEGREVR